MMKQNYAAMVTVMNKAVLWISKLCQFGLGLLSVAGLGLSACTALAPEIKVPAIAPPQWYAPSLPHQGSLENMQNWWAQLQEPILVQWISAAQILSPNIANARAQVFTARANVVTANEALFPTLTAVASTTRQNSAFQSSRIFNSTSFGLQSSWELGIWGDSVEGVRRVNADLQASKAGWHAARVLVAVEVARLFYMQRSCWQQLHIRAEDRDSRKRTLHNLLLLEAAGFRSGADTALAQASMAEGERLYSEQQAVCDNQVKSLVALTGIAEPALRDQIQQIQQSPAPQLPHDLLRVPTIPGQVLVQRPDVYQAQKEWVHAGTNVSLARAALLPSLRLEANFFRNYGGFSLENSFNTWSLGPLQATLPLFNRDGLAAQEKAAYARFEAAGKNYEATLRNAVREVEQALVNLNKVNALRESTTRALDGYNLFFQALEVRYQASLASLLNLEEARRLKIQASIAAAQVYSDQMNAWVSLYQALGGGFDINKSNDEAINAS